MARVLIDFPHGPGGHCGSTVLRDMLRYYGYRLTEDMVFGLGAGLGFVYFQHPNMRPPVYIGGRIFNMESIFCDILGVPMEEITGLDDDQAWSRVKGLLDDGIPPIVTADVYYLDYLRAKRHFSGHRVVIVGYDEELGVAYVADNDRDSIQECSLDNLRRARSSDNLPQPADNAIYIVSRPDELRPIEESIAPALERVVSYNLRLPRDRGEFIWDGAEVSRGIWGTKKMSREVSGWEDRMEDGMLEFMLKNIYVTVEKGGTGYGGFFRRIYGRYLLEASEVIGLLPLKAAGDYYCDLGDVWTGLAVFCRNSSSSARKAMTRVSEFVTDIIDREIEGLRMLEEVLETTGAG